MCMCGRVVVDVVALVTVGCCVTVVSLVAVVDI